MSEDTEKESEENPGNEPAGELPQGISDRGLARDIAEIKQLLADAESRDRERAAVPMRSTLSGLLRKICGVEERLIAEFPSERTRFTAMGGIVLGTSLIAAVSMWFAITNALDEPWYLATPVAAIWGLFIINLDRWLMVSMSRDTWQSNLRFLLPRFAIAVVFAFIIAEPLVLRLFDVGIEQHVRQERIDANKRNESMYRQCNPAIRSVALPQGCAGYVINVTGQAPTAQLNELDSLQRQIDQQTETLDADRAQRDKLESFAQAECNGTSGSGLSGHAGEGPNCLRNRAKADEFEASADLDARQAQLETLRTRLAQVTGSSTGAVQQYEQRLSEAINDKIQEEYRPPSAKMGLIERFTALNWLSIHDPVVFSAQWSVRILFITIECLPVLVKLMSGKGPYDRAVSQRVESTARLDQVRVEAHEETEKYAYRLKLAEMRKRLEWSEVTLDLRQKLKYAERRAAIDIKIAENRQRLLAEQASRQQPRRRAQGDFVP